MYYQLFVVLPLFIALWSETPNTFNEELNKYCWRCENRYLLLLDKTLHDNKPLRKVT